MQTVLQNERFLQEVRTAVHTAYAEAVAAWRKTGFSTRLLTEAATMFEAAKKRYGLNLLSTQDVSAGAKQLAKNKDRLPAGAIRLCI